MYRFLAIARPPRPLLPVSQREFRRALRWVLLLGALPCALWSLAFALWVLTSDGSSMNEGGTPRVVELLGMGSLCAVPFSILGVIIVLGRGLLSRTLSFRHFSFVLVAVFLCILPYAVFVLTR